MISILAWVLFACAVLLAVMLYFWPTIAAIERRHDSTFGVFVLNLLGGWTLIGWVVAIVWAYNGRR